MENTMTKVLWKQRWTTSRM